MDEPPDLSRYDHPDHRTEEPFMDHASSELDDFPETDFPEVENLDQMAERLGYHESRETIALVMSGFGP